MLISPYTDFCHDCNGGLNGGHIDRNSFLVVNESPLKSYCDVDFSYYIGEIVGGLFYFGRSHSILDDTAVVRDNRSAEEVESLARAN